MYAEGGMTRISNRTSSLQARGGGVKRARGERSLKMTKFAPRISYLSSRINFLPPA